MLTSDMNRQIRDNVVTDVNANVLAPEQPRRATLSPEAAILFNKAIVARPLMVPEVCSVRVKNTEYRYRWVNHDGKGGMIHAQRRAQGFTNATTDDVEILGGDATADKGEIRAGDLILMKIRADIYEAALKYNMEKALILQRSRGMYRKGNSDVNSDAPVETGTIAHENYTKTGKASNFIPDDPEKLFAGSDVGAARAQTAELRDNIAAGKKSAKEA